ncbi:MAG: twin-arginine translocase subunit TatB [Betaproteobacteria bacterium]|jgi:sec-independent protein translocase protein TatB|nr:twin-arginine translocase subunit TatB [Betaproteobacteria bacterium]MBK6603474.1 twin-arginine translocase subunit TatB [Betaproteobacteria bacterium]MBK7081524.1 twin-arginine translocase subunit TatB [Betaproteobacteria bacterium]MBK7593427.1 twin-arginine translocase subunit TatB [Betaproteobacteria bacterium]MBK8689284.1 twin-arginine translocase subunit TatB [Betaproteobacteria bacterium]
MFDIAFSELVIIGVVALIIIGPEKLPKTARTLGHLFGRLQRYVSDVKADISREMELEELRKLQTQVQSAARDIETSVSAAARDVETGVRNVESELNAAGAVDSTPAPVAVPPPADFAPPPTDFAPPPQVEPPVAAARRKTDVPAEPPRQASLPGFDRG